MRRPGTLLPLVLLLLLAPVGARGRARAGEPTLTAAEATEPGRRLDRALDIVLDGTTRQGGGPRTLVLLVDPSASLRAAGLAEHLEAALARHAPRLEGTQFAVAVVGARETFLVPPTGEAAVVSAGVRRVLEGAKDRIQNVFADLRAVASAFAGRPGVREIALLTLENGDVEDDLEGTVRALERAKARCFVLTQEAFLSDSWFASHAGKGAPKGATFTGGDAAFHELPWGWAFQVGNAHEQVGCGFAPYGLSRVAAASGGRVFLVDEGASSAHGCASTATCPVCSNDHQPPGAAYVSVRLRAVAPLVGPRDEVLSLVAKDPWYRAAFSAWAKASEAGLVRSRPSLEISGGTARPSRETGGTLAPLSGNGTSMAGYAKAAGKALEACERIRRELEGEVKKLGPEESSARGRAVADHVRLMLAVTRANLVQYVGWCQTTGPALVAKGPAPAAPELAWFAPDVRFTGVSWSNLSLCHGPKPYLEAHLPGGPATRDALADLDTGFGAVLARWEGTPFATAARRAALARFFPTVQGKPPPPEDRRRTGQPDAPPTTTSGDRPARGGGGSTTGGGPTTGGD
jgi:hypothetical protein